MDAPAELQPGPATPEPASPGSSAPPDPAPTNPTPTNPRSPIPGSPDASLLPESTSLPAVADAAFDRIASLVQRVLDVPVALVTLVDRRGQVFPGAAGLAEPWATSRATPLSHSFCQHVVAAEQSLVVTDARTDPRVAQNLAIRDIGVIGYAGMPLHDASGTVVGSLCAIDTRPREWTAAELHLLADLAATCSAELQLRSAAARVVQAAARTETLLVLAEALSTTTTVADVAEQVGRLAGRRFGATGGVALAAVPATAGSSGTLDTDGRPGPDVVLGSAAAALHSSLFVSSPDELAATLPATAAAVAGDGFGAIALVPLQVDGPGAGPSPRGGLWLAWPGPRGFDRDDRELIAGFARYTAQALHRALLVAERRDVAHTLQAALLPVLPELEWADLAGRYVPAQAGAEVGGDWYEAAALPDGSLAVAVGDVMGHDISAAATMGRLQAMLHALTVTGGRRPGAALDALDRVMALRPDRQLVTAVAATISPRPEGGATLAWANAGHPPPLVLVPGEQPRYLDDGPDRLLGMRRPTRRRTWTTELPAGATVLFFTDGLIEHREREFDDGLDALAYAADLHRTRPLRALVDAMVTAALAGGQHDDTIVFGVRLSD